MLGGFIFALRSAHWGEREDLVALLSFDLVACAFSIVVCVESFVGYDFVIVAFSEQLLYCL